MVVSRELENHTQFILNPADLHIKNQLLLGDEILFLLKARQVNLVMDVYDSDPFNLDKAIMVFIHGNSASRQAFDDQISYYSKYFRVIACDLFGHGKSTKISELDTLSEQEKLQLSEVMYNPYAMIAGVKQLCEVKCVKDAHIIGWSLGGHIAYGLAMESPQLISSIITIGSPPVRFSMQGLMKGFNKWFVDVLIPEWINNPKKYTLNEAKLIARRMGLTIVDKIINDIVNSDPLMRKYMFCKLKDYDSKEYTATVLDGEYFVNNANIPLCLIVGDDDQGINAEYIGMFNEKLLNDSSQVIIMKNAPHAVHKTHTKAICNIIDSFIKCAEEKSVNTSSSATKMPIHSLSEYR